MNATSSGVVQTSPRSGRPRALLLCLLASFATPSFCAGQDEVTTPDASSPSPAVPGESLSAWQYAQPVPLQGTETTGLVDFILTPSIFDGARVDLADLRLYDANGREIPYALRVRTPRQATQPVPATEFNDVEGPDKTHLVSLDLGEKVIEHNEVQIKTDGDEFRREVLLEGSPDGEKWSVLAGSNSAGKKDKKYLLSFGRDDEKLIDNRIAYNPCRLRYLRINLHRDPLVDTQQVPIKEIVVRRRVEVPGEYVTREVTFGERQAFKTRSGPGSAWFVDLEGRQNPCERLEVDIADAEFARDYFIEAAKPPAPRSKPWHVSGGAWQRRAGEKIVPMVAEFQEQRAARLRLSITDHRNPVLQIQGMRVTAAVRQLVFEVSEDIAEPVHLYYGNPKANAPNYDIAKNLPDALDPPPSRVKIGLRQENPSYLPEPLPLTERLPWLIYVLLGFAVAVLGLLIINLARAAIAVSDRQQEPAPAES